MTSYISQAVTVTSEMAGVYDRLQLLRSLPVDHDVTARIALDLHDYAPEARLRLADFRRQLTAVLDEFGDQLQADAGDEAAAYPQ